MMYGLPEKTKVNRLVPKKLFLEKLGGNARMRKHFTDDIEYVNWYAKLVSDTLNVGEGKEVLEIAVFVVPIRKETVTNDVFVFIDNMMPRYTVFILEYNEQACLLINYKEKISGGNTDKKYRIIKTYHTEYAKKEDVKLTISGLSMDSIYETLVRQIAGDDIKIPDRNLRDAVDKTEIYNKMRQEVEELRKKVNAECQPTKKFDLFQQLSELECKIKQYEKDNNKSDDNG